MDFYGPSSKEFTDAYMAAYDEEPSYHAAGGFVAGLVQLVEFVFAGARLGVTGVIRQPARRR